MTDENEDRESGTTERYSVSDNHIERSTFEHGVEPWKDPHVLRTLYHERDYSQADIAQRYDISQQIVSYWMEKLDVESDPPMHERDPSISREVREDGRVNYKIPDGDGGQDYVYESQLVALTDISPHEVFAEDTHVHHEMGSPIKLNVPANLDVLGDAEHIRLHAGGAACLHPEEVLDEMDGFVDADDVETDHHKRHRLKRWHQQRMAAGD